RALKDLIPGFKKFAARRAAELKDLGTADLIVTDVELSVAGQRVRFRASVERIAAWELYVELQTRVATQDLSESDGLLREALGSLHAIFSITRQILKAAGPGVAMGQESLGGYSMAILNRVLRPLLAKWHPALLDWEAERPRKTPT